MKIKPSDYTYSLSKDDLERCIPFECNIIPYNELNNYKDINEILYPNGAAIIHYETERKGKNINGHWCCITLSPRSEQVKKPKDSPTSICYFDSYGINVDDGKKLIDKEHQQLIGQLSNTLSRLLYLSGNKMEWNEIPLQEWTFGNLPVNTCGRHVLCRIILKDASLEDYQDFMLTKPTSPDQKVITLTDPCLKSQISSVDFYNKLRDIFRDSP